MFFFGKSKWTRESSQRVNQSSVLIYACILKGDHYKNTHIYIHVLILPRYYSRYRCFFPVQSVSFHGANPHETAEDVHEREAEENLGETGAGAFSDPSGD
jgi:hypothetical protein